jgi:hypothetical protein
MDIQNTLIFAAFILSLSYLVYLLLQIFKNKGKCHACASAACNHIDFEQIEKKIKAKNALKF